VNRPAHIRTALPKDAVRVSALAGRTFRTTYPDLSDAEVRQYCEEVLSVERFKSVLTREDSLVLLAESASGNDMGYAQLQPTKPPPSVGRANPVELVRLYLELDARHRGAGSSLLEEGLTWARARNHGCCWARVWDQNPGAAAFYRSHGFSVVGAEPYRAGGMDDRVWIMQKDLDRGAPE